LCLRRILLCAKDSGEAGVTTRADPCGCRGDRFHWVGVNARNYFRLEGDRREPVMAESPS